MKVLQILKESSPPDLMKGFEEFLPLAMNVLGINKLPPIKIVKDVPGAQPSFGGFDQDSGIIYIQITNRHPLDIFRTLAHELVHFKQDAEHKLDGESGRTGSPMENEANATAGIVMRYFNKRYPEYLGQKPLIKEDTSDYEIHNYEKLDKILTMLCKMVIKGQQSNKGYGMVAAAVLDPDNQLVAKLNYPADDGLRVHAERAAMEAYKLKYGEIPKGSIVITTCSPCNEIGDETADGRSGNNCTDLINNSPVRKVYCGYIDPSQGDEEHEERDFNLMETENGKIRDLCKSFAATWLDIDESLTPNNIHTLADRKGVKWDNEPSFLKLTKRLTGHEHLDDLDQTDLQKVKHHLEKQGVAEGATVTRIDSKPVTDFVSGLKAYKHTDDWSQSGLDTGDDSYWKNKNLKTNTTKGLFAGDPRRTALYATGNAYETRYVEFTQNGQPIVYFDQKDLPAMRSRKTYLTVFDAGDFRQLPTGEWFSENPSKPIKQMPIGDPFKYIASQGWIVRVTDDLGKVFKQVKNMHKAGKIAHYGAEGMNESKQGVAEGIEQKPVIIYTNNRGATIDDGIKKSLPVTELPANKLQMWEKHKSMKDPKIANWVTNKLLPELKQNGVLKPLLVWNNDGEFFVIDGNHRFIAYQVAGYQGRVPVQIVPDNMVNISDTLPGQQGVAENFADGKNPGRKGLAKRSGVNTKASVSSLRKTAKNSSGEKQRMAHWLANMKAGRAK